MKNQFPLASFVSLAITAILFTGCATEPTLKGAYKNDFKIGVAVNDIELYTPTIAREMPMKNKRRDGFSVTNQVKARLHQTEPPNALPASERCPGQPSAGWEVLSLSMRSSLSVMAATIPTMSAQGVAASVPSATPEWNW